MLAAARAPAQGGVRACRARFLAKMRRMQGREHAHELSAHIYVPRTVRSRRIGAHALRQQRRSRLVVESGQIQRCRRARSARGAWARERVAPERTLRLAAPHASLQRGRTLVDVLSRAAGEVAPGAAVSQRDGHRLRLRHGCAHTWNVILTASQVLTGGVGGTRISYED